MMHKLRERALMAPPAEIGLGPAFGTTGVWLALMETGHREAAASLVCVADGSTSLYFSNGGGVIGAGEHDAVRDAALQFIAAAARYATYLSAAADHPLPSLDRVRFYARSGDRLLTAEDSVAALSGGKHALSPLFIAGHGVITAIRETGAGA